MSNYLESYLSNLEVHHRNNIINNCIKNKHFDNFLSSCNKLNFSVFEGKENTPKDHKFLLKRIKEYKELIVKSYGLKIVKEYKKNIENIQEFIKINHKKLESKLNCIELIINILNNLIDAKVLKSLLINNITNKKINYTKSFTYESSKIEFVDFSHDLFITSDELSTSEDNKQIDSVNLVYSINTPFIAEYSN